MVGITRSKVILVTTVTIVHGDVLGWIRRSNLWYGKGEATSYSLKHLRSGFVWKCGASKSYSWWSLSNYPPVIKHGKRKAPIYQWCSHFHLIFGCHVWLPEGKWPFMDQPQRQAGAGECCMPVYCKKYATTSHPRFLQLFDVWIPNMSIILSVKHLNLHLWSWESPPRNILNFWNLAKLEGNMFVDRNPKKI